MMGIRTTDRNLLYETAQLFGRQHVPETALDIIENITLSSAEPGEKLMRIGAVIEDVKHVQGLERLPWQRFPVMEPKTDRGGE
jgi:hypothetical protein